MAGTMLDFLTNQTTTGILTWVSLLLTVLIPILMAFPAVRRAILAPVVVPIRRLREPYDIHGTLKLIGRAKTEIADLRLTLQMPTKAIGFVGGLVLANSLLIGMALFWGSTNDRYSDVMITFIMLSMFVIMASVGSQLDRLNNHKSG